MKYINTVHCKKTYKSNKLSITRSITRILLVPPSYLIISINFKALKFYYRYDAFYAA